MKRLCFALDLIEDAELIQEYCRMHEPGAVWPAVLAYIRAQGIEEMEIWRRDGRLFMIVEATEDYPRALLCDALRQENARWEALMSTFQRALAGTPPGEKWAEMRQIFRMADHVGHRPS